MYLGDVVQAPKADVGRPEDGEDVVQSASCLRAVATVQEIHQAEDAHGDLQIFLSSLLSAAVK